MVYYLSIIRSTLTRPTFPTSFLLCPGIFCSTSCPVEFWQCPTLFYRVEKLQSTHNEDWDNTDYAHEKTRPSKWEGNWGNTRRWPTRTTIICACENLLLTMFAHFELIVPALLRHPGIKPKHAHSTPKQAFIMTHLTPQYPIK